MRFLKQIYIPLILIFFFTPIHLMAHEKKVIAHRGASGYLMEHNLPSVVLAVTMGADYIEQDLVMTKDDILIVLHDLTLDRVTNVGELFAGRERQDGKFYAIDFTLSEIKQLTLKEPSTDGFRFPNDYGSPGFTIPTFAEELALIRGLEKTLKKSIGICPEIKKPWFHKKEGKDISRAVLSTLTDFGYDQGKDKLFIQCFDYEELKRIHNELFPMMDTEFQLIQLIDHNNGEEMIQQNGSYITPYNYDWMFSKFGLKALSMTMAGIGLEKSMLVNKKGEIFRAGFVKDTKALGLQVHVYTFRADPYEIPSYAIDFNDLLDIFFFKVGADSLFTDHCDKVIHYLKNRQENSTGTDVAGEQKKGADFQLPLK